MFFLKPIINLVLLIHDYVDKEMNDEGKLQQQLLEARLKYEMDELAQEEYEKIEATTLQRIREIKERKLEADEEYDKE